jgi:hypothetical protein
MLIEIYLFSLFATLALHFHLEEGEFSPFGSHSIA